MRTSFIRPTTNSRRCQITPRSPVRRWLEAEHEATAAAVEVVAAGLEAAGVVAAGVVAVVAVVVMEDERVMVRRIRPMDSV